MKPFLTEYGVYRNNCSFSKDEFITIINKCYPFQLRQIILPRSNFRLRRERAQRRKLQQRRVGTSQRPGRTRRCMLVCKLSGTTGIVDLRRIFRAPNPMALDPGGTWRQMAGKYRRCGSRPLRKGPGMPSGTQRHSRLEDREVSTILDDGGDGDDGGISDRTISRRQRSSPRLKHSGCSLSEIFTIAATMYARPRMYRPIILGIYY